MTTTDRPSIFSLPPDERRAAYDEAFDRVVAAAEKIACERKAQKPDPRGDAIYRIWRTIGLVCVLVVKHSERSASIECSKNGSERPRIFLPNKCSIVQPDSVGEFLLVCVPKWLATKAGLAGVTPDLAADRAWTKADLAAWESLRKTRMSVNSRIYTANRRTSSNISRSNAA